MGSHSVITDLYIWLRRGSITLLIALSVLLQMQLLAPAIASARSVTTLIVGERPGEYPTIQSAIDAAIDGDSVLISSGLWEETIDLRGKSITIAPLEGEVILDAAARGTVITCVNGEDADTIIEGLIIRGGLAERGAGLLTRNSTPVFRDCVFEANEAIEDGAAWYGDGGGPTFMDCLFLGNSAQAGDIFGHCNECTPLVLHSRFTGNCPQPKIDDWMPADAMNTVDPLADTCEQAIELTDGATPFATICAASEHPGHVECELDGDGGVIANDIWYRYTPMATGLLRLSTCGWSDFDTDLAVYRGSCQSLDLIGCNDDAPGCPGGPSELTLPVRKGEELLVRLGGGVDDAAGRGFIEVELHYSGALPTLQPSGMNSTPRGEGWLDVCPSCTYTTIQDAIDDADETIFGIFIEAGSYTENLVIRNPITLLGDSSGTGVYIDGTQTGPVITVGGQAGTVALQSLSIINGRNSDNGFSNFGGGISVDAYAAGDRLKISDCTIGLNFATHGGGIGAVPDVDPELIILNSQITINGTPDRYAAGGIEGDYRRLVMDRGRIERNFGTGILCGVTAPSDEDEQYVPFHHYRRSSISYNTQGGMQLVGPDGPLGTRVLNNCLFVGNGTYGAFIEGNTDVAHCTFAYNRSEGGLPPGLRHDGRVSNSIFWGNAVNGNRLEAAQISPQTNVWNSIIDRYSGDGSGNLIGLDPMFADPSGADGVPGVSNAFGIGDEVYSILQGSPAIDAANTQTDYEYENEYYWLNPVSYEVEFIGPLYAFNECYDWNGDGVAECLQHLHNDDVYDSPLGIPWNGFHGDIGCYEYFNTHSEIRYFVWSNEVQGPDVLNWNHPFNWYTYDYDWVFPNDPAHSVILTTDQMSYEQPYSPTGINYSIRDLIVGPGDWNFDASSTRIMCENSTLVGTISGEEPAELTISGGFELETTRLLIDGQGQGRVHVNGPDTSIDIEEKLQLARNGSLQVTQGGSIRSDSDGDLPGGGSILNLGGVLETGAAAIQPDYIQYGTLPLPSGEEEYVSGTLVLQPGQAPDFAQQIQLGGTVRIDFSGRSAAPGATYDLLRFNGGSVKNTGIQCTGLPANTFLRVRRETDSRTAAEVLVGEVTSVDEVFGLNEGNESSIAREPTDAKLGDVNDDGLLDLAFTLPGATELDNGNFVVLLNEGDSNGDTIWDGFETSASFTYIVGLEPMALDLGDHADDGGALDAVIANKESGSVTLITDIPSAAPGTELTLDASDGLDPDPVDVCFFDIEGNGRLDIIVASEGDATLRLIENTGSSRGARIDAEDEVIDQPNSPPWGVEPGDEEAPKEAGVTVISRASNKSSLFRRSQSSRAFTLEVDSIVITQADPIDVATGNFDNDKDGVQDTLVINQTGDSFQVLLRNDVNGDGFSEFTGATTFELSPGTSNPQSVDTGDFDNDGDIDIAIVMTETIGGVDQQITRVWRNDLIYDGVESELLTFTDTFTNLPSTGEPTIVVAGEVDDVGGDTSQIGDDVVILSSGTTLRGSGNFVNPNVGGPVPIGTVTEFEAAIAEAEDGDTILLAAGSFQLNERVDFTDRDFSIIGDVDEQGLPLTTIIAAGANRAIWMTGGQSDATRLENLVVEGGEVGAGIYMENTADPGPQLINCIIRNCNWHSHGAGIRLNNAHPTLNSCRIESCTAAQLGGGAYIYNGGGMIAVDCTFESNAAQSGGGIYADDDTSVSLENCSFEYNSSTGSGGGVYVDNTTTLEATNTGFAVNSTSGPNSAGGGIYSYGGSLTMHSCTLVSNSSSDRGGGIAAVHAGSHVMSNCTFNTNSTTEDDSAGGGLFLEDCTIDGAGNEFLANQSRAGGGAWFNSGVTTLNGQLEQWTFWNNQADVTPASDKDNYAGALFINSSSINLLNFDFNSNHSNDFAGGLMINNTSSCDLQLCTFSGNTADRTGGGLYINSSTTITLDDCTINQNSAPNRGGGIHLWNSSPTIESSLVIDNHSAIGGGISSYGSSNPAITDSRICDNTIDQINGAYVDGDGNCMSQVCDTDEDGAFDCVDGCPTDPNKTEPGDCGCGNPETDTDGDGIPDCIDDPCPADLDDDHDVDVTDLLGLIGSWGPCDPETPCPADVDGSGDVGVLDLLALIASWGDCPQPTCTDGFTCEDGSSLEDYVCNTQQTTCSDAFPSDDTVLAGTGVAFGNDGIGPLWRLDNALTETFDCTENSISSLSLTIDIANGMSGNAIHTWDVSVNDISIGQFSVITGQVQVNETFAFEPVAAANDGYTVQLQAINQVGGGLGSYRMNYESPGLHSIQLNADSTCYCLGTTEGTNACVNLTSDSCSDYAPCDPGDGCPAGFECVTSTCCPNPICMPICQ